MLFFSCEQKQNTEISSNCCTNSSKQKEDSKRTKKKPHCSQPKLRSGKSRGGCFVPVDDSATQCWSELPDCRLSFSPVTVSPVRPPEHFSFSTEEKRKRNVKHFPLLLITFWLDLPPSRCRWPGWLCPAILCAGSGTGRLSELWSSAERRSPPALCSDAPEAARPGRCACCAQPPSTGALAAGAGSLHLQDFSKGKETFFLFHWWQSLLTSYNQKLTEKSHKALN